MKYYDHWFWRVYEYTAAVAGWGLLVTLPWMVLEWFLPALMPEWPLVGSAHDWLAGCIVWIIKADTLKYRITKDPRDEPIRKWFTFRNARSRKVIMLRKGVNSSQTRVITTVCPFCDVLHGFEKSDKEQRICGYENCKAVVSAPH